MEETLFGKLSEDLVLKILGKLEEDPRNWARLACVCTKFSSIIRNVCWKTKCLSAIPSIAADLLSGADSSPPGGWASLHKIGACCPGLVLSGVLLDNSDFGLDRDLGPNLTIHSDSAPSSSDSPPEPPPSWSLYDDLYHDTLYNADEGDSEVAVAGGGEEESSDSAAVGGKRRRVSRQVKSHMAAAGWKLRREQGGKLLHSRFRGDSLYISDWPGCVHVEEKRNYMLFRGVFKDFKASGVWRAIKDSNRPPIDLRCAFCSSDAVWDLHSTFCLRRFYGFHDDGDPVVRAYVCPLGHVSGAWTDLPLYT